METTHLGEGNTSKSNRVDKTRRLWLTVYVETILWQDQLSRLVNKNLQLQKQK